MADVIDLLISDHRAVDELFTQFESTTDPQTQRQLADAITVALVKHSEAEEQAVYPMIRKSIPNGDEVVEHEISEHSEVEKTLKALDGMDPENAEFLPLMRQVISDIRHHVEEEENEVFPQFRQHVSADELQSLGETVQRLEKMAPTHPHPAAPDHPPFNALLAPGASLVDHVRDLLSGRGKG